MLDYNLVADSTEVERKEFYKKTYLHVAVAILAFIVVEGFFLKAVPTSFIQLMVGQKYSWLLVLGIFWVGSIIASKWSLAQSRNTQYLGLGLYIFIEAIIFLPLMYVAVNMADSTTVITQAAMMTLALFVALSVVAFTSKTDFSFLRTIIIIGGFVSLGLIVAGMIFGFNLGLWFSAFMVLLASGSIVYETSKLKNVYQTDQYVGAALQLFASVMLLFWYILRIFLSRRN